MKGIVRVGMEEGRRIIYQTGNRLNLAIEEESQGGIIKTRRVESIEFIPIDEMENNGGLLEKDIVYLDGGLEWQRGIVIGKIGSMLLVRKKRLFDGVDMDRKERVPIDYVMGVVKDQHEES